jgi:multiple sugar transport system substrate-binding protein
MIDDNNRVRPSRRGVLKSGAAAVGGLLATSAMMARPNPARAQAAKPDKLTMLYATVEADSDAVKTLLPQFKSANGIDIAMDTMPYNALQQKVFAELASKSSYYDIVIVDAPWMSAIIDNVAPITDMMLDSNLTSAAEFDVTDFIPKVFYDTAVFKPNAGTEHWTATGDVDPQAIKKGGFEIYGLPIQANALTMSYRKDLFEDATNKSEFQAKYGKPLAVPDTWDDFVDVAAFFTRPAKRLWGTTLMGGAGDWSTDDFKTFLASFGGDGHMIDDKFEPVFAGPEGVAALTFYADLINKHKVTPPGTTSASWDTVATTFETGLVAMSMNYHTETLNSGVHGAMDYAMVPKKVQYGPHFGAMMLSVNAFSKNKEWAYRAIQWLTGKASQSAMLPLQLHPTRRSAYELAAKDPSYAQKFGSFYTILGKSLENGVGRPRLKNYSDVDRSIWVAVNDAARGAAQPAAALAKAAEQVKKQLAQAGYTKG